ncbi:MAG: DUF4332 domain-containing protein [Anaerolineales bacterium]
MGMIVHLHCLAASEAHLLVSFGIASTDRLLLVAAHKQGREDIANETDLAEDKILQAVHNADMMRVDGIGTEYAGLLEEVGVRTLKQLARRNPERLYEDLEARNEKQAVVRRMPSPSDVHCWVRNAHQLDSIISY